ncbi:MAG: DUF4249 domain-containing protein [Bacteroidales bacterium]
MRKYINILWISLLLFTSTACREKIDIHLDSSYTRLVVNATFTNDTLAHTVVLTQTLDYYEPSTTNLYVSGASVYITDGEQIYYLSEDSLHIGYYRTQPKVCGQVGKTYTLHISNVDIDKNGIMETYTATDVMPAITDKLDSIRGVYGIGMPPFYMMNKNLGWNILLYASDPPSKEYYVFILSINGHPYNDALVQYKRMPDDFTQGLYINGLALFFIEDSKNMTLKVGDTIGFEARSITAGYNQYIDDVQNAVSSSTPIFGSTPANVRGNISNGAIGYFAVYSTRRASTILKTNTQN